MYKLKAPPAGAEVKIMYETPEGIGSRKFSLRREDHILTLMQGATPLAALSPEGEKVMFLLVTAPQLWESANDVLRILHKAQAGALGPASKRLGNMIAKSVGKDKWADVEQP